MSKPKRTPLELLNALQKLNPDASAAELKELLYDQMQKEPEAFARLMLDDLFAQFERETGYRGDARDGLEQFAAWLNRSKN
jgi:hypothetical protein